MFVNKESCATSISIFTEYWQCTDTYRDGALGHDKRPVERARRKFYTLLHLFVYI
jgi:hypothetical protein